MMKIRNFFLVTVCLLTTLTATFGQGIGINEDDSAPDVSAILDVKSTTKGILVPRMTTTQREAIMPPATGLLVYDTTTNSFWFYSGTEWTEIGGGSSGGPSIHDENGDTFIHVEHSADENIIRFYVKGTEYLKLDTGRLEFLNTGESVFIGEGAGENDSFDTNGNTYVGHYAGYMSNTGVNNTFLGLRAATNNVDGAFNVVIGANADVKNLSGSSNTILGAEAGGTNLGNMKSGNVFIGYRAGYNEDGDSTLYIDNSETLFPLIYGDFASDSLIMYGSLSVGDTAMGGSLYTFPMSNGSNGQVLVNDGSGNLSWSDVSSAATAVTTVKDADDDTKIQVEEGSDDDIIRFDMAGTEFFRMDSGRLEVYNTGGSVFLGLNAGLNDDYTNNANLFTGVNSGLNNTSGANNIALGNSALWSATTTNQNVAIGNGTLLQNTSPSNNVAIGYRSGAIGSSGHSNVMLGMESGYNQTGDSSVFLGFQAGYNETASNTLYIANSSADSANALIYGEFDNNWLRVNGRLTPSLGIADSDGDTKIQVEESSDEDILRIDAGGREIVSFDRARISFAEGAHMIAIGTGAAGQFDFGGGSGVNRNYNIIIGDSAGANFNYGGHSILIGAKAGYSGKYSLSENVFIGHEAGYSSETDDQNVYIGANSGYSGVGASYNTYVGYRTGYATTTGDYNVFLGYDVGYKNTTGAYNVFIGEDAGYDNTEGRYNVYIGSDAGANSTEADYNTFVGEDAGLTNQTGGYNTFIGSDSGFGNETGGNNIYIGRRAYYHNEHGHQNTIIGVEAGYGTSSEDSIHGNVMIGYQAGYNETTNNKLYIENSNTTTPLIWGDFENDRLGINRVATTNTLEVGGSASKSSAGDWLANSDARLKKNITQLHSKEILTKLLQLKGVTYEWNDDKTTIDRPEGIQYGFTAQNIQQVFPSLVSEDKQGFLQTAYGTYDAMYIEAIRALNDENQALANKISQQETQLKAQAEELATLKVQIAKQQSANQKEFEKLEAMMEALRINVNGTR